MKRKYITPGMESFILSTRHPLLVVSGELSGGDGGGSGDGARASQWDEEW